MRTALTIAGSDSGGGAGIQADLKTFAAHGIYGTSALTAVTAQNTLGVSCSLALPAELVAAQIEAVVRDIGADAAKTGMLATAAIVETVAAVVETLGIPNLVVDPVMVAKSGDRLLEDEAVAALRTRLFPRARIVTPNAREAEVLTRLKVRTLDEAREAARRIHGMGPASVLIKGGHLEEVDAIDLFYDGRTFVELCQPRAASRHTHGTGCTLAAALAAGLALGHPLAEAVAGAKAYVTGAIRHALALGRGHGPLDHFWRR